MDKNDAIIFITPNVGEYYQNNIFFRNLNSDEINFLGKALTIEYRKKHNSYTDCISDLKEKMTKIKKILEE